MDGSRHTAAAGNLLVLKLGRDTRSYVPAALVPAAASLASVSIFTRIFTTAEYGRFSLVVVTVTLSCLVLSGWIQQSILRYMPEYSARGAAAEFSAGAKRLIAALNAGSVLVLVLVYYAASRTLGAFEPLFLPAVLLLVTEITLLNLNTLYQAQLRSGMYAGFRIAGAVARLTGALVVVLFFYRSVTGLMIGTAVGQLAVVVPMWLLAGRAPGGKIRGVRMDGSLLRSFLAYGIPVIGWTLGGQVLGLSDRYIIGLYRGEAEVGVYSASYNLVSMGFGLVATPLLMAAHPIIMNAWRNLRRDEVPGLVKSFSRYYLLAALPVVAIVSVLGREIVELLVGEEFREGYRIFPWVLGGTAAWGLAMYGHKGFELLERTRLMFVLVVACAVVNVLLNLVFVPRFGFTAAAVTTFAGYALYPALVFVLTRRGLPWRIPWRTAAVSAAAALVGAAAARILANIVDVFMPTAAVAVCAGAVGVVVYAVIVKLAGELKPAARAVQ